MTTQRKRYSPHYLGEKVRDDATSPSCPPAPATACASYCLTRLAEAGCTPLEIMAISAHKNIEEVQKYCEAANRKRLAKAAMVKLMDGQASADAGT